MTGNRHRFMLAALALVLGSASAQAAANFSIGPRYWAAEWRSSGFNIGTAPFDVQYQQGAALLPARFNASEAKLDRAINPGTGLYGGTATLGFGAFGITGTYLTGTYDLRMQGRFTSTVAPDPNLRDDSTQTSTLKVKTETTRRDADFAVFFRVAPPQDGNVLNLFVGYKFLAYEYKDQDVSVDTTLQLRPKIGVGSSYPLPNVKLRLPGFSPAYSGVAIGFNSSATLGKRLFSFGNVSYIPYMMANKDAEDFAHDSRGWLYNIEAGFGLNLRQYYFVPTISYRLQQLGGFGQLRDTFHGVAFNLAFAL